MVVCLAISLKRLIKLKTQKAETPNGPDREQLVQLVREVQNASACSMDFDALMNRVEKQFGDKQIGRLIFDPPGGTPLSAEEIVDIALSK